MDGRRAWWMNQVRPLPVTEDGSVQTSVPMWFCRWCRFYCLSIFYLSIPCAIYFIIKQNVNPSTWVWKSHADASVWFCLGAGRGTLLHIQICRWQLFSVSPMTDSRMILLNTLFHYLLLVTHHFANWQRAMEGFPLTVMHSETYWRGATGCCFR